MEHNITAAMEVKTKREAVIEQVNQLFVYTDSRDWDRLIKDVFKEKVHFQTGHLGVSKELSAREICQMWEDQFTGIDRVHHMAGNFIAEFYNEEIQAKAFCYATAAHYKEAAIKGNVREFTGSYEIHLTFTDLGWRVDKFRYDQKYVTGNAELA
jgi:hypothetical protein